MHKARFLGRGDPKSRGAQRIDDAGHRHLIANVQQFERSQKVELILDAAARGLALWGAEAKRRIAGDHSDEVDDIIRGNEKTFLGVEAAPVEIKYLRVSLTNRARRR